MRRRARRRHPRPVTLFETRSPLSGRIRVVQRGPERRLMMGGETQSVYYPGGDWSPVEREYWAQALAPLRALPPRPRVLLLGLGGGTQVHLVARATESARITVIERDPAVVRVAGDWFGLGAVAGLEILCRDAEAAIRHLALTRRRFDFVMEDISYLAPIADAIRRARSLAALVAPGGVLVLNQHRRPAAQAVGEAISDLLPLARLQRVRRLAENVLVFAGRPGPMRRDPRTASG